MRRRMQTFHRGGGSWPQVINHLDGRRCPTCKGTVHGPEAVEDHGQHHLDEAEYRARINEWTVYVEKLGRQVAELCRLLNVEPAEDLGVEDREVAGESRYGVTIEGGRYIPAGEPVE